MTRERAGFWRRLGALLLDCIVLTALVQVAAIVLYPISDGRLQANGLVRFMNCQSVAQLPAGVAVPAEYAAGTIKECRVTLLGLEYGHYLEVEAASTGETDSDSERWTQRLDGSGARASAVSLDILILPLMMLWCALADGRSRQTLGRRAAGLTVMAADGSPPGSGKALLRQLLLWWPALLSLPFDGGAALSGGFQIPNAGLSLKTADILGLASLVWYITAIAMIVRRTDPLYDRWTGTKVIAQYEPKS